MKKAKLSSADILLPKNGFEKWAVIACDQFTSEKEYWEETEKTVGDAPSALRIVLPEVYLDGSVDERIAGINATMQSYIDGGVLEEHKDAMIYVERTQSDGIVRHGIVGAVDLDDYDYRSGSRALIRATEQTVIERIPPRVKIRRDAPLELPHVLLLIDDPEGRVIEPLEAETDKMKKAYDFELMQGGGHIKGWFIDKAAQQRVNTCLEGLMSCDGDMLFAVGDGNHSLATAKECSKLSDSCLASSALVEVVNIHDKAINFEPIYRVLFGVDPERVIADMKRDLGTSENGHTFTCVYGDKTETVTVNATAKLPVGTLQSWLDGYIKDTDIKIDYIHGESVVENLCKADNTLGFVFDGMKKYELFEAVMADGSLPRKTFSMGHASDKRYYIEARKIK